MAAKSSRRASARHRRAVHLLALIGLVIAPSLSSVATIELNAESLRIFCSDKKLSQEQLTFRSPGELRQLIGHFEAQLAAGGAPESLANCRDKYGHSIAGLRELLDDETLLADVCSERTYRKLRRFHLAHIHFYKPELSRNELLAVQRELAATGPGGQRLKPIPASLRRFFVLFVKQINSACKQRLVNKWDELVERRHYVGDREFALMKAYKREGRRLLPLASLGLDLLVRERPGRRFKSLEILDFGLAEAEAREANASLANSGQTTQAEAAAAVAGEDDQMGKKLYVQVKFNDGLKRISDVCKRKFQPVYNEFLAPVVRLNNLGYVDHSSSREEDEQLEEGARFARWFEVVRACEVLKDVEVLHDPSTMSALVDLIRSESTYLRGADTTELNRVRLLSRAQADELRARAHNPDAVVQVEDEPVQVERAPVRFAPRMWLTDQRDLQREYQTFDADLERLIGRRVSAMRHATQAVGLYLKSFIQKHRREIEDNDKAAALGQFSAFCARHNFAIKVVMIVIATIFIAAHVAG